MKGKQDRIHRFKLVHEAHESGLMSVAVKLIVQFFCVCVFFESMCGECMMLYCRIANSKGLLRRGKMHSKMLMFDRVCVLFGGCDLSTLTFHAVVFIIRSFISNDSTRHEGERERAITFIQKKFPRMPRGGGGCPQGCRDLEASGGD